jgi:hypothetical protein
MFVHKNSDISFFIYSLIYTCNYFLILLVLLQYLYGAQELRIVNPFTFFMQRLRVYLRGKEKIRPSLRLHFLSRRLDRQQFFIYILCTHIIHSYTYNISILIFLYETSFVLPLIFFLLPYTNVLNIAL